MNIYNPTYLYIKQHTSTGKLYFGKTIRNPESYTGSGKHWKSHINKHGKEHILTLWYCLYYNKEELTKFALMFSEQQNIVKSDLWANLKAENGLDGGETSNTYNYIKNKHKIARHGKDNYAYGKFGKEHPAFGNKHTEEYKKVQSNRMKNLWNDTNSNYHKMPNNSGENNPMHGKTPKNAIQCEFNNIIFTSKKEMNDYKRKHRLFKKNKQPIEYKCIKFKTRQDYLRWRKINDPIKYKVKIVYLGISYESELAACRETGHGRTKVRLHSIRL